MVRSSSNRRFRSGTQRSWRRDVLHSDGSEPNIRRGYRYADRGRTPDGYVALVQEWKGLGRSWRCRRCRNSNVDRSTPTASA